MTGAFWEYNSGKGLFPAAEKRVDGKDGRRRLIDKVGGLRGPEDPFLIGGARSPPAGGDSCPASQGASCAKPC